MSAAGRPRLLLVDDEPSILASLERTLRREGYEIHTAQSVTAALRLIDAQPFDLVLSDQKMPGSSGLELLDQVSRRSPSTARMLITGWPGEVPAGEIERLGIRALLPKPWDANTLKQTLRKTLNP